MFSTAERTNENESFCSATPVEPPEPSRVKNTRIFEKPRRFIFHLRSANFPVQPPRFSAVGCTRLVKWPVTGLDDAEDGQRDIGTGPPSAWTSGSADPNGSDSALPTPSPEVSLDRAVREWPHAPGRTC